jgi:predicted Zn-dependent protease
MENAVAAYQGLRARSPAVMRSGLGRMRHTSSPFLSLALLVLLALPTGGQAWPGQGWLGIGGGPKQIRIGDGEPLPMDDAEEIALGHASHAHIVRHYGIYDAPRLAEYVQRIGEDMAAHSSRPNLPYRFTVLDSQQINAFAQLGGFVYITRGLLALLGSEAELAAILGHEIGHVAARHLLRQRAALLALSGGTPSPLIAALYGQAGISADEVEAMNGLGREQELEADRLGAINLAQAGYPAMAMIEALRSLQRHATLEAEIARAEGRTPATYHALRGASHPDQDRRLQVAIAHATTLAHPLAGHDDQPRFLSHLDGLIFGDGPLEALLRGGAFRHPRLGIAFEPPPGWRAHNEIDRLVAQAPGGGALLLVSVRELSPNQAPALSPERFLQEELGLRGWRHAGPIRADLPSFSAVVDLPLPGQREEGRVTVVYLHDRAFLFIGRVRDRKRLQEDDRAFLAAARSLRPLVGEEATRPPPLRIRVRQALPGETFEGIAARSPVVHFQVEILRLLNARPLGEGRPTPGEWIKVVE